MKICFIASQISAWGKIGGFGSMTRTLGKELVKRGVEVSAVVPRRKGQRPIEKLDGISVYSYHSALFLFAQEGYKLCDADIYHSEDPTFGTYLCLKAMPKRKHIVTCIDPRDCNDWKVEFGFSSLARKALFPVSYLYEASPFVKQSLRKVDAVFCQARFIIPKTMSMYRLSKEPGFLPNPVYVPNRDMQKANKPTVCFLARWDRRKRPELFFELAKKLPQIKFIAVGKAHDKKWDKYLREKYASLPNLEMTGFIDIFRSQKLDEILEKSWILVNPAAREGLPAAFLEAASCKCAILSSVNPDEFSTKFGYYVQDDDFASGLKYLLDKDRWRQKGESAYRYVKSTYEVNRVIDQHLAIYEQILASK